jgi:hypothetical protein
LSNWGFYVLSSAILQCTTRKLGGSAFFDGFIHLKDSNPMLTLLVNGMFPHW